jgi:Carboxypeptidase regulatory-like domain
MVAWRALLFGFGCSLLAAALSAGSISGQVSAVAFEEGVPGVSVRLTAEARQSLAVTDLEGRFVFEDVAPGDVSIVASMGGFGDDEAFFCVPPEGKVLSMHLQPPWGDGCGCWVTGSLPGMPPPKPSRLVTFSGTVLDEVDRPVKDVDVYAVGTTEMELTRTGPDGTFRLDAFRDSYIYSFMVSAAGYRTVKIHAPCDADSEKMKVWMRRP